MAGNAAAVKMGACWVTFGTEDLGYTKGGVKVSYKAESMEKTVDQEDAPIGEVIMKQNFEVKVPMAEYELNRLVDLMPGATIVTDATTPTKKKMVLSGSTGTDLLSLAQELVIAPVGGTANDAITLHYAVPKPEFEFSYEKDKERVYEVTFKALKGVNGFVTFGDKTATA